MVEDTKLRLYAYRETQPGFASLPQVLCQHVFSFLEPIDVAKSAAVCWQWDRSIALHPTIWRDWGLLQHGSSNVAAAATDARNDSSATALSNLRSSSNSSNSSSVSGSTLESARQDRWESNATWKTHFVQRHAQFTSLKKQRRHWAALIGPHAVVLLGLLLITLVFLCDLIAHIQALHSFETTQGQLLHVAISATKDEDGVYTYTPHVFYSFSAPSLQHDNAGGHRDNSNSTQQYMHTDLYAPTLLNGGGNPSGDFDYVSSLVDRIVRELSLHSTTKMHRTEAEAVVNEEEMDDDDECQLDLLAIPLDAVNSYLHSHSFPILVYHSQQTLLAFLIRNAYCLLFNCDPVPWSDRLSSLHACLDYPFFYHASALASAASSSSTSASSPSELHPTRPSVSRIQDTNNLPMLPELPSPHIVFLSPVALLSPFVFLSLPLIAATFVLTVSLSIVRRDITRPYALPFRRYSCVFHQWLYALIDNRATDQHTCTWLYSAALVLFHSTVTLDQFLYLTSGVASSTATARDASFQLQINTTSLSLITFFMNWYHGPGSLFDFPAVLVWILLSQCVGFLPIYFLVKNLRIRTYLCEAELLADRVVFGRGGDQATTVYVHQTYAHHDNNTGDQSKTIDRALKHRALEDCFLTLRCWQRTWLVTAAGQEETVEEVVFENKQSLLGRPLESSVSESGTLLCCAVQFILPVTAPPSTMVPIETDLTAVPPSRFAQREGAGNNDHNDMTIHAPVEAPPPPPHQPAISWSLTLHTKLQGVPQCVQEVAVVVRD